jgi:hypothetical protein
MTTVQSETGMIPVDPPSDTDLPTQPIDISEWLDK